MALLDNRYDPKIVADYIRQAATARGISPDIALRVAQSEGLKNYIGDSNSSFGPFQLHYGGVAKGGNAVKGLGDTFTQRTGLDARDPSTWPQQVDFALDEAKRGGWAPWHGWKGDSRAGLLNSGATPQAQPSPPTPEPPPFSTYPTPQPPASPTTPTTAANALPIFAQLDTPQSGMVGNSESEFPTESEAAPQYDKAAMRGLLASLFQQEAQPAQEAPQAAPELPQAPPMPMKRGRGLAFQQLTVKTPKFTRQA